MVLRLCYRHCSFYLVSPLDLALGSQLPRPEQPQEEARVGRTKPPANST